MSDIELTSAAERLELITSNAVNNRPFLAVSHQDVDFLISLARAGLEAHKAEESMRERAAKVSVPERQQAWAALRMIAEAVGELFGPAASIESEDASLLRGPEYQHFAEGIVEALQRAAPHPSPVSEEGTETVRNVISDLEWVHRQGGLGYRIHDKLEKCIAALASLRSTKP